MDNTHDKPAAGGPTLPHDAPLRVAVLGAGSLRAACLAALLERCDPRIAATGVTSAAELPAGHAMDLAVLPLLCPHRADLSQASHAVQALRELPLAVFIDHADVATVRRLVVLGFRGVLTLDLDPQLVAPALRLVAAGGLYVPPEAGSIDLPEHHRTADAGLGNPATLRPVSPRERAVLDLLRRSLSNREIAAALGIAEATVKIHVRNLLRKTRARNRVELALMAVREGA